MASIYRSDAAPTASQVAAPKQSSFGTAPRKVNGTWQTSAGRALSAAGQKYWEGLYRTGRTDAMGHMSAGKYIANPQTIAPASAPLKKPGFDTILKARKGDHNALAQVKAYTRHQGAVKQAAQQTQALSDNAIFGGSQKAVYKAAPQINPVGRAIVNAVSPVEAAKSAFHDVQQGNVLGAGIQAAGLFPFGKFGRVAKVAEDAAKADKVAQAASVLAPREQLVQAMSGAKRVRNVQEAGYSAERAKRAAMAEHIYQTVQDPHEADKLVSQVLKGELPKVQFNGLKDFTHETLTELKSHVNTHPRLTTYQKKSVNDALNNAYEGKVPTSSQLALIQHVFGKKNAVALSGGVNHSHLDKVINALNIPRTLMATADLSAPLRQGLVALASHPILSAKQFPSMVRYFGDPGYYATRQAAIHADPDYHLALAAKLSLTDLGPETALAHHEEAFASDYAAQIPGIGHIVKGSGRAYTGYLNDVRMSLFKNQLRIAQNAGRNIHDEKFLTDIGKVINAATGRGTIGPRGEHIMPALNTIMFSPRLMLSRINYLNPAWYVKLSPQARLEALRGLFSTAGAVTSALYLFSRIPGVKVGSLDPRNADFGKLKIGNTRIDVAAGFQQYVRLASELATNTKVSSVTGAHTTLGSGYGKPTAWDEILNFFENKSAPPVGMAKMLLSRKDSAGNPVTAKSFLQNYFTPLLFQDAKDLYNEHHGGMNGIEWALGGYGVGLLGVGLQTYGPKPAAGSTPANGSIYGGKTSSRSGSIYSDSGSSSGGGGSIYR